MTRSGAARTKGRDGGCCWPTACEGLREVGQRGTGRTPHCSQRGALGNTQDRQVRSDSRRASGNFQVVGQAWSLSFVRQTPIVQRCARAAFASSPASVDAQPTGDSHHASGVVHNRACARVHPRTRHEAAGRRMPVVPEAACSTPRCGSGLCRCPGHTSHRRAGTRPALDATVREPRQGAQVRPSLSASCCPALPRLGVLMVFSVGWRHRAVRERANAASLPRRARACGGWDAL